MIHFPLLLKALFVIPILSGRALATSRCLNRLMVSICFHGVAALTERTMSKR